MNIRKIDILQILDSRGWPTLAGNLELEDGRIVNSSVPSGASVGKYEALEKRDRNQDLYFGRGVAGVAKDALDRAVSILLGRQPDLEKMDLEILELDGTKNKTNLGANVTLILSLLVSKAQALLLNMELFEFLAQLSGCRPKIPCVRANLINGGCHANNGLLFQEFMVQPISCESFELQQHIIFSVYHTLRELLQRSGMSVSVGAEGGFAPRFNSKGVLSKEKEALELLCKAIDESGNNGKVGICLDVAASEFYDENLKSYNLNGEHVFAEDLIGAYSDLVKKYNIVSIEDGLAQDDWDGWSALSDSLQKKVQIIGDDLFATQPDRIKSGIEKRVCNAVLIKPNQIGTISETLEAVSVCRGSGYAVVPSHRSGETNDSFIADLAVGISADQCKIGAPARGERVAKYNRLAEIARKLEG